MRKPDHSENKMSQKRSVWPVMAFLFLWSQGSPAATFLSADEKIVSVPLNEDLYIAAGTIMTEAPVRGDVMAAGGQISINDSITEDLAILGGDVFVNAYVGDDVRILAGNIRILGSMGGDLIVCGGEIRIDGNSTVGGDLVIWGGHVIINGRVNGNIRVMGGKVTFNGIAGGNLEAKGENLTVNGVVKGSSVLAANRIKLLENAQFHDHVRYWQRDGELSFSHYMANGRASFDPQLELYEGEVDWKYLGLGILTFWILYTLSVLLTLTLIVWLLAKSFAQAGELLIHTYARSFGYGALYFLGFPLIACFFLVTVIGIPVGMVLLMIYAVSLLFANCVASLVIAYAMNARLRKNWNKWYIILAAALIFLVLKVTMLIPFAGWLFVMVVIGMAYGALIAPCLPWHRGKKNLP